MNDDIDIVSDLASGAEPSIQDASPLNAGPDTTPIAPNGTQSVHGDSKPVNQVEQPNTPPEKATSLRDQISTAFKGEEGQPVEQAQASNVAATPLSQDAEGKYRNADGTFASIEQIRAFEQSQQPSAAPVESQVLGGMTPAEQAQFQSLPAELQQYVGRTMEELNSRAGRFNEYDLIEQNIFGPRRQALESQGTSMGQALHNLFALSDFAGTDPANFVLWFADNNKIDLDQLLDDRDAKMANPGDPVVAQLQSEVQQLRSVIDGTTQTQAQQAHEARLAAVQNFSLEKDEGGNLKRPYLTEVTEDWSRQIQLIRASNPTMPDAEVLQKAYDNACWTNPNVRASLQKASQEAARQQNGQRVAAATAAGASITGGPSSNASTASNTGSRSLRDEIKANFAASQV